MQIKAQTLAGMVRPMRHILTPYDEMGFSFVDNHLELTAYGDNMALSVYTPRPEHSWEGYLVIPKIKAGQFFNKLSGDLTLGVDENNNQLCVTALNRGLRTNYTLEAVPDKKDYFHRDITISRQALKMICSGADFKYMLECLGLFTEEQGLRQALAGINLRVDEEGLVAYSTDGFKFSTLRLEGVVSGDFNVAIPPAAVDVLLSSLKDGDLEVWIDEDKGWFVQEGMTFETSFLLDYPDVPRLVPDKIEPLCEVDSEDLARALKIVRLASDDKNYMVSFVVDDKLTLGVKGLFTKAVHECRAIISPEEDKMYFNLRGADVFQAVNFIANSKGALLPTDEENVHKIDAGAIVIGYVKGSSGAVKIILTNPARPHQLFLFMGKEQ